MALAAAGTYPRNTIAVKTALLDIRRAEPEAVVMVGAYKPCAEFIRLARRFGMDAVFVNISFVGTEALAADLGEAGAGVILSQVVPHPQDVSIPLVADYHKALAALDPAAEPGFVSLEGYVAGRLAVEALRRIDGPPTREALIDAVYRTGSFDLGGLVLDFGPGDNQGSDAVFLTVLQPDGSSRPVDRLSRSGT